MPDISDPEARKVQTELERVGCLREGNEVDGNWLGGSQKSFQDFLDNGPGVSAWDKSKSLKDVNALFAQYEKGASSCAPIPTTGLGKCNLNDERKAWYRNQDQRIKGADEAYVGLETLVNAIDATLTKYNDLVPPISKRLQSLVPPQLPKDLNDPNPPKIMTLADISSDLKHFLKEAQWSLPIVLDYWAIDGNMSCRKCMYLAAYQQLKQPLPFGDTEIAAGGNSIALSDISLEMIQDEYQRIQVWYAHFLRREENNATRDKAKVKLDEIVKNLVAQKAKAPLDPALSAKAETLIGDYADNCKDVKVTIP